MRKILPGMSHAIALSYNYYVEYAFFNDYIDIEQFMKLEKIAFNTAIDNGYKLFDLHESIFSDCDQIIMAYN